VSSERWTDPQAAAVAADGGLTVSAGAGSGKTAVLTERAVRLLLRFDADRLLVVTFTEAAAAEMKERIGRRLAEADEPRLQRQAALLPRAQISTLHAFCLTLLRRHGTRIGLPPGFTVAEAAEAGVLRRRVLDVLLGEMGDGICAAYGEGQVVDAALGLHDQALAQAEPEAWLRECARRYAEGEVEGCAAAYLQSAGRILEGARERLLQAAEVAPAAYVPVLRAEALALPAAGGWDELSAALRAFAFGRLPPSRDPSREAARRLRDQAKEDVERLARGPLQRSLAEHREEMRHLAPLAGELAELVLALQARFSAAKRARGWLDFNDLEHLALRVAPWARGEFDAALVDEYQDTSPIQDALLAAVAPAEGIFRVGDVQQSIYGFRLAAPDLFRRHMEAGPLVALPHNFRSRAAVIAAVNGLAGQILPAQAEGLAYQALVARAAYEGADPDVRFYAIEAQVRATEAEAAAVAQMVRALLDDPPQVRVGDETRPCGPDDVALLLRAGGARGGAYAEALRAAGVPVASEPAGPRTGLELLTLWSLLATLDNPSQDIPLAATLRSPLIGLDASDLAEVRASAPEAGFWQALLASPHAAAAERIDIWRSLLRRQGLGRGLRAIVRESGYLDFVAALPDGSRREAEVRALLQRALAFEQDGIPAFLEVEAQRAQRSSGADSAGAAGGVHILTIHGSKGLEYPVVVLAGCGSPWNREDTTHPVGWRRELGLGLAVVDRAVGIRYPTLPLLAVRHAARAAALAEEARLLYVAMTRAREHLWIVGTVPDLDAACARWVAGSLADGGSALDWLGTALARLPAGRPIRERAGAACPLWGDADPPIAVHLSPFRAELAEVAAAADDFPSEAMARLGDVGEGPPDPNLVHRLRWRYPHAAAAQLRAKASVTEIKGPLDPLFDADAGERSPARADRSKRASDPLLDAGARESNAAAGTATHILLRHLDFGGPPPAVQLAGLIQRELLTPDQAAEVDLASVQRWLAGPLAERVRRATLRREAPFYLRRQAGDGEWQLVQGVVDVLATEADGRLLLLDFKTGRRDPAHREQVRIYAEAVGRALRRPVDEIYLCYLGRGDERIAPGEEGQP
jgi:ATP-dependent helicase/nuclease subunit A